MKIIHTETKQLKTLHYGTPPADCIPVPPRLEKRAAAYAPYCDLMIEDGALVDILPLPRPEPEQRAPTEQDDLAAMAVDHEYRLTLLELGVTNDAVQNS